MKKTYISPELIEFRLNTVSMLCLSKGDDENDGIAESKKFWGGTVWEEEEKETEEKAF